MKILGLILIFPFVFTSINIIFALVFKIDDKNFKTVVGYLSLIITLAIYGVIFLFWK